MTSRLLQLALQTHITESLNDQLYDLPVHITGDSDQMECPYIAISEDQPTPDEVLMLAYTCPITLSVVTPLAEDEGGDKEKHFAIVESLTNMLSDFSAMVAALDGYEDKLKVWAIQDLTISTATEDAQRVTAIRFDAIAAFLPAS